MQIGYAKTNRLEGESNPRETTSPTAVLDFERPKRGHSGPGRGQNTATRRAQMPDVDCKKEMYTSSPLLRLDCGSQRQELHAAGVSRGYREDYH